MNQTISSETSSEPPPLSAQSSFSLLLGMLLKRPAQLIELLLDQKSPKLTLSFASFSALALFAYGIVVGSFSGGDQWLAAPLKISLGALACALICLPSLFIFASLAGAEITLLSVFGILSAALSLTALLLIGLVPVVWVFSKSTDSIAFIGALHIVFWLIAVKVGLGLLRGLMTSLQVQSRTHLHVWAAIFVLVSLQMTTALRPIIGKSNHWLTAEKKFFAVHWAEHLFPDLSAKTPES